MKITSIPSNEFHPYYGGYIALVDDVAIPGGFKSSQEHSLLFFNNIPEDKWEFSYQEGKWTPKEILLHLIDTERVFAYRALFISRTETKANLSGFDQDEFVKNSNANSCSTESLINEYITVRNATCSLFESLKDYQLLKVGKVSDAFVSVRALAKMILGHEKHHLQILNERYL